MEKDISKAKVLVCDDSMMVRNKMKKLLTAYGFTQIFEANDGAQAVEKAVAQATGQAQQATEKTEENAPEQADGKADEK